MFQVYRYPSKVIKLLIGRVTNCFSLAKICFYENKDDSMAEDKTQGRYMYVLVIVQIQCSTLF